MALIKKNSSNAVIVDGDTYHVRVLSWAEFGKLEQLRAQDKPQSEKSLDVLEFLLIDWSHAETLTRENISLMPIGHVNQILNVHLGSYVRGQMALQPNLPLEKP